MRHRIVGRKFNRSPAARRALLKSLSRALITYGMIKTTLPKAKELRRIVEPFVTKAKKNTVASKRLLFAFFHDEDIVLRITTIALHLKDRPGGYTRVLKAGYRQGDAAPMAYIGFVDFPDGFLGEHNHAHDTTNTKFSGKNNHTMLPSASIVSEKRTKKKIRKSKKIKEESISITKKDTKK